MSVYTVNILIINVIVKYVNISTGVGAGATYGPTVIVMATYFEKRRALANGIAITSVSLGSFCFPPLIQSCLDYYGLQGTFIIMAGIMAHVCAAAMLYRQPGFYLSRYLLRQKILRQKQSQMYRPQEQRPIELTSDPKPAKEEPFRNEPAEVLDSARRVGNLSSHAPVIDRLPDCRIVPANGGETGNTITTLDSEDTEAGETAVAMANTLEMAAVETMTRENARDSLSGGKSDLPKYVTTTANGAQSQKASFQWNVLKNPLLYIYVLTLPISDSCHVSLTIMLHPHATDMGISKYNAAFLLSMMGICGGVASLVVGWFADFNLVKKKHIYQAATIGNGIILCLFPLARQYVSLAVMAGLISVFFHTVSLLAPVLLAEELGLANMPITAGLMYRFVFRSVLLVPEVYILWCVCVCVCVCACVRACVRTCMDAYVGASVCTLVHVQCSRAHYLYDHLFFTTPLYPNFKYF